MKRPIPLDQDPDTNVNEYQEAKKPRSDYTQAKKATKDLIKLINKILDNYPLTKYEIAPVRVITLSVISNLIQNRFSENDAINLASEIPANFQSILSTIHKTIGNNPEQFQQIANLLSTGLLRCILQRIPNVNINIKNSLTQEIKSIIGFLVFSNGVDWLLEPPTVKKKNLKGEGIFDSVKGWFNGGPGEPAPPPSVDDMLNGASPQESKTSIFSTWFPQREETNEPPPREEPKTWGDTLKGWYGTVKNWVIPEDQPPPPDAAFNNPNTTWKQWFGVYMPHVRQTSWVTNMLAKALDFGRDHYATYKHSQFVANPYLLQNDPSNQYWEQVYNNTIDRDPHLSDFNKTVIKGYNYWSTLSPLTQGILKLAGTAALGMGLTAIASWAIPKWESHEAEKFENDPKVRQKIYKLYPELETNPDPDFYQKALKHYAKFKAKKKVRRYAHYIQQGLNLALGAVDLTRASAERYTNYRRMKTEHAKDVGLAAASTAAALATSAFFPTTAAATAVKLVPTAAAAAAPAVAPAPAAPPSQSKALVLYDPAKAQQQLRQQELRLNLIRQPPTPVKPVVGVQPFIQEKAAQIFNPDNYWDMAKSSFKDAISSGIKLQRAEHQTLPYDAIVARTIGNMQLLPPHEKYSKLQKETKPDVPDIPVTTKISAGPTSYGYSRPISIPPRIPPQQQQARTVRTLQPLQLKLAPPVITPKKQTRRKTTSRPLKTKKKIITSKKRR